jgi:PAS domain S-box-containing protein
MDARYESEAAAELKELRRQLDEAEQTLRALRRGEADALVIEGKNGLQVYTLKSAAEPYRILVEQMHEGALTLSSEGIILYCNEAFARIAGGAAEHLTGSSILGLLAGDDFKRLSASSGCPGRETLLKRGDGVEIPVFLSSTPLRNEDQDLISAVVTDLSRQQLRLRYEAIVESISLPVYTLSPELIIQSWNPGAEELYGYSVAEIIGRPLRVLCPEGDYADIEMLEREVRRLGHSLSADVRRQRKDGSIIHVIFSLTPLRDAEGQIAGYAAIAHDITERKAQERMRQLLMAELNHRVKNSLAMVLSIARFTERQSHSLEDFSRSFSGRVLAMARAHDILTATSWEGAHLEALIGVQLIQSDAKEDRYSCNGPEVKLQPQAAISLALVLHELGTNASKYGALSQSGGRVHLTWETGDDGRTLHLRWKESGGPQVLPRTRRGFGSFIIEESLSGLDGTAEMRFEPGGLMCVIRLPLG